MALDLENTWRHIPVYHGYRPFLAVQLGRTILQFAVLHFALTIAPWVFTKMIKPGAQALSHQGDEVLMYLSIFTVG